MAVNTEIGRKILAHLLRGLSGALMVTLGPVAGVLEAQDQFDALSRLPVRSFVDPALLRSQVFKIDPTAENDGLLNYYTVRSTLGVFTFRSTKLLELRASELEAAADINKRFPSGQVIKDAVTETGQNIVMGPINAVGKVVETVQDREKLQGTIAAVPRGVMNLFAFAGEAVVAGSKFVVDTGRSALSGSGDGAAEDRLARGGEFVVDSLGEYSGYSKAARQIYKEYRLDPATDFAPLGEAVRRVSSLRTGVSIAGRLAPSLPSIPYVGSFNKYAEMAADVAAYDDPARLERINRKLLEAIGEGGNDSTEWRRAFEENSAFTPLMRTAILKNLEALGGGVAGKDSFIKLATIAKGIEGALFYVSGSEGLLRLHRSGTKLKRLLQDRYLPCALAEGDELHVVISGDHLVWTKEVADLFNMLAEGTVKRSRARALHLHLSGTASARAKAALSTLGFVSVRERQGF